MKRRQSNTSKYRCILEDNKPHLIISRIRNHPTAHLSYVTTYMACTKFEKRQRSHFVKSLMQTF